MMKRRRLLGFALMCAASLAHADAVDTLRDFVRDVKSGRAAFTQTVTAADGARKKTSSGDGVKVWIYDADLNQASSRKLGQAIGSTPAALLAGSSLDADFVLAAQPAREGLEWARATPKAKDGPFQSMSVGFKGRELAAVEIIDSFGQRSVLNFARFEANVALDAARFNYTPPKGADVIEQ
jgi:outer membrane lipoprotein carrier protein